MKWNVFPQLDQGNHNPQNKTEMISTSSFSLLLWIEEEYSTEYIFHSSCFRSRTDNSYLAQIRTVGNDDSDVDDSCNDDYNIYHTMIKSVCNDVDEDFNGYGDLQTRYIKYMIHVQKKCELVWTKTFFSDKYVFQTVTKMILWFPKNEKQWERLERTDIFISLFENIHHPMESHIWDIQASLNVQVAVN